MGSSSNQVEQIRQAIDPLDIIKEAVPSLKSSGQRWKGNCPFHNERTPSFFFMPEKGLWHCFGSCQEGGDIFKFVMKYDNLTFPEALRKLADKAGIKLQFERTEVASREAQERDRLLELLTEAAVFYRDALTKLPEAEPARRHLAKRQIKPETINSFQLGYAPLRNGFLDLALRKGANIEDLMKAGLAVKSAKSGRYHDPLWNRLIFPILDSYGRVVGFGGRVLEEGTDAPKYINSPETPVYSKSRHLYGLYQGRQGLRTRGQGLLVEGYMDVIGCHQAGADHAVAPLGTAFTAEQAKLLRRYVQEVVLLFDPDDAGLRAAWRSAPVLVQADIFLRVASVPGGLDPDELILKDGMGALDDVIRRAQDVVDFWLDRIAQPQQNLDPLNVRLQRAEKLLTFIKDVPNELLREEWLSRSAQRLALDKGALTREMQKMVVSSTRAALSNNSNRPSNQPARTPVARAAAQAAVPTPVRTVEEEIIQILSQSPEAWGEAPLRMELFRDLRCRSVVERLKTQREKLGRLDLAALSAELNAPDANWLSSLLLEEKTFADPAAALAQRLKTLEMSSAELERKALEKEILRMTQTGIPRDEAKEKRYLELTNLLKTRA